MIWPMLVALAFFIGAGWTWAAMTMLVIITLYLIVILLDWNEKEKSC